MEYVHRCEFCGWSRMSGSAAMVAPFCEGCGCGLVSLRRSDVPEPELSDVERLQRVLPAIEPWLGYALRVVLVVLITVAAARAGYSEGGPALGVIAFGLAGLLTVPMAVPGRYRPGHVDPAGDPAGGAPARVPSRHR